MSHAVKLIKAVEQFNKSKQQFVQTVAGLASTLQDVKVVQESGVISLLCSLMYDGVPSVRCTAVQAVGRLVIRSEVLAEVFMNEDVLPRMVQSLDSENKYYKRSAAFVLRAVAKHSPELSQALVDCGAVDALVLCLEELDWEVKEDAASALCCIAQHNVSLSQLVVDAGAVNLLVLCLLEHKMSLKRIAASTLSEICKFTPELAQTVVENDAIPCLAKLIPSTDAKLKRHVFSALSHISKHSVSLAEMVVLMEDFPAAIPLLRDPDECVRQNVATLMKEVVKHTPELAQVIVNSSGIAAVVDYLDRCHGDLRLPGIVFLGNVAAHNETLAMAVITSKGVTMLAQCLAEEPEQHVKAAIVWSVGQIGRHTPGHAMVVTMSNLLPRLLELYMNVSSSEDLQEKSKKALKSVLQMCTYMPALKALLFDAPSNILKHVVCQFSKVLPHDSKARRQFVTSGGLTKVLEIEAEPGSALQENINTIKSCFPEEIVRYHSPGYAEGLLQQLEN